MYANYIKHFPWMNLMILSEILFIVIFLGALFWVFRKGSEEFYKNLSQLPLEKGTTNEKA